MMFVFNRKVIILWVLKYTTSFKWWFPIEYLQILSSYIIDVDFKKFL